MFMRALFVALLCSSPASAGCLAVDELVEITGYPLDFTVPGPPEFESVHSGDRSLQFTGLFIREGLCIENHANSLHLLQINCSTEGANEGTPLTMAGKLFESHSGYHWTSYVLDCQGP